MKEPDSHVPAFMSSVEKYIGLIRILREGVVHNQMTLVFNEINVDLNSIFYLFVYILSRRL